MSCDAVQGNQIWFVNGSSTTVRPNCQNLFIPVEKIDKQNPVGQTTATIGVPFTYKLTIPVLFDSIIGHRGQLTRVAERFARRHDHGRSQRNRCGAQLRKPHR